MSASNMALPEIRDERIDVANMQIYMSTLVSAINIVEDAKEIVDGNILDAVTVDAGEGTPVSYRGMATEDLLSYFTKLNQDINRVANMIYILHEFINNAVIQAQNINSAAESALVSDVSGNDVAITDVSGNGVIQ